MKKTKTSKLICLFLTVLTVISILPTAVFAACSHSYSKVYSYQNANMHSYETVCSKCGDTKIGTGYSGWENHTFNTSGKCTKCGYSKVCGHTNTTRKYNNLSSTQHEYYTHCNGCGIDYYFTTVNHSYSGGTWTSYSSTQHKKTSTCACGATKTEYANHSFSGNKCTVCGYTKTTTCSHSSTTKTYSSKSETQHTVTTKCSSCGTVTGTTTESHSFSGNSCTKCGYTKTATVTASVTLSASSSSGTLGSAGGEISAEGAPASYTVKATASGCSVTKITYTQNGRTYTVSGSSVTITANSDSDFTTTTFTAYTSVSGVTATFTVNHKVVKHTTSQVMWETSNTAVIRSITGNGMNKSLSYSMTIPTSYNGQSNLSADQVATIQSLIGVSDGKTYTVKYTRTITVYTPAQYSSTGSRVNLGTFDGNDSSQINDCLSRWGWSSTTAEAIRQAASSSLTFTTGIATNCTAKWINTDTNQQLYSKSFGTGTVSASSSKTVSVSYSDYSGSGNYVFENLSYSGDTSGTSTNQSFSTTYTATSKPLTVTFYCHPSTSSTTTDDDTGDITVYVRDRDTNELLSGATVSGAGKKGTTNTSGGVIFRDLTYGTYSFSVTKSGYVSNSGSATISSSVPSKSITIYLSKIVYDDDEDDEDYDYGDITIYVRDSETNAVISSASVYGRGTTKYTSTSGYVTFYDVPYGSYSFSASKSGYESNSTYVTTSSSYPNRTATIYLTPEKYYDDEDETGDITVYVRDADTEKLISGATVSGCGLSKTTSEYGYTVFYDVSFGTYPITASMDGYESKSVSVTLSSTSGKTATIYLTPEEDYERITFNVRDSSTSALIPYATIEIEGQTLTTDANGAAMYYPTRDGSFTATASKQGYETSEDVFQYYGSAILVRLYIGKVKTGTATVYVRDKTTDELISGAKVSGFGTSDTTGTSGCVAFSGFSFGTYSVSAEKDGYEYKETVADISEGNPDITLTIYLDKVKPTTGSILIYVLDYDTHEVIDGAKVKYEGVDYSLDSNGSRLFTDLAFDNHVFVGSAPGYESYGYMDFLNETRLEITHTIYLHKIKSDVSITANDVNGTVYRGSTIMVAATVHGDSEKDFTPSNPLTVTMKAKQNGSTVFSTQTKSVICPKGESNLVWFAVTVPNTGYTSSNDVTFTFEVSPPSGVTETSADNNIASKTVTPTALPTRTTPKPSFELTKPSDFKGNVYKSNTTNSRSWTVWEWDGKFVKKTYSPTVTVSATLTPDSTAVWKTQNKTTKLWTTRSGYGLNTSVSLSCTGIASDMLSGNAKVNAYYPEFNYSTSASKSNMLLRTAENTAGYTSSFTFDADSDNLNNAKMHKTPVWFPDGEYSVKYEVYDLWTPAGEITGTTYAVVNIEGSMYDDYYTNHN